MGLKNIVSVLLPGSYREQVLGDLHERGFRLRDIVSAIPAAWIAHLHREWIAPVPQLAGASEAAIRRRMEQLRRGAYVDVAILQFVMWIAWGPRSNAFLVFAPPLALTLLVRLFWDGPSASTSIADSRRNLLDDYRAILHRRMASGLSFVWMPLFVGQAARVSEITGDRLFAFVSVTALAAAGAALLRASRLRREMLSLSQNPAPLA